MPRRGTLGRIVESRRNGREELLIEWQIRNFFTLPVKDSYDSSRFCFCNTNWHLRFFPNTNIREQASEWVNISLIRLDSGPPEKIIARVGVKGGSGEREMKNWIEFEPLGRMKYCWLIEGSMLRRQSSLLLPPGNLTFICELKINTPSAAKDAPSNQDVSVQTDREFTEPNDLTGRTQSSEKQDASSQTDVEIKEANVLPEENESSAKQGTGNDIGKDIGKLLVSGENSDIVMQVRDVEFKVHKVILSVRSPVLAAIFRHETTEKATNRISISDCEPRVFKEFLHYLYTGSVQLLTQENVFGLYQVADKYLADDLKLQCLKHIQDTLCVETFCNALQLALTHGESGLLKFAIDFASKNLQSIMRSVQWQNFICEYPREANEILIKCYNTRS